MSPEQIKKKYGIEPIMKEMWVWFSDEKLATKQFVLCKENTSENDADPLFVYEDGTVFYYTNASETNPNEKEPKVGDKGYFWDDERYYVYDSLYSISDTHGLNNIRGFNSLFCGCFVNFSHEKQSWMR